MLLSTVILEYYIYVSSETCRWETLKPKVLVLFLGFNGFLSGSLAVADCCSALEYSRQDSITT